MAFSKAQHYSTRAQLVSLYARAISHPARIIIIEQLMNQGPMTVELIGKMHPISQAAISAHLKILRKAQLVLFKEHFPYTLYRIDKKNLALARESINTFIKQF